MKAALVFVAWAAQISTSSAHVLPCENRQVLLKNLLRIYSESPRAIGLSREGDVLEILSSPEGSSWTIILTSADGLSCLLATGEGMEFLPAMSLPEPMKKGLDG